MDFPRPQFKSSPFCFRSCMALNMARHSSDVSPWFLTFLSLMIEISRGKKEILEPNDLLVSGNNFGCRTFAWQKAGYAIEVFLWSNFEFRSKCREIGVSDRHRIQNIETHPPMPKSIHDRTDVTRRVQKRAKYSKKLENSLEKNSNKARSNLPSKSQEPNNNKWCTRSNSHTRLRKFVSSPWRSSSIMLHRRGHTAA